MLNSHYLFKVVSSIFGGIYTLLILFLLPSSLGPTEFGEYVFLLSIFTAFISFVDSGFSTQVLIKLSKKTNQKIHIKFILNTLLFLLILLLFIIISFSSKDVRNLFIENVNFFTILSIFLICFFVFIHNLIIKIFDAYDKTVFIEKVKIFSKLINIFLLILLFITSNLNINNFLFVQLIYYFCFFSLALFKFSNSNYNIFEYFKININNKRVLSIYYSFSKPLFIFNGVQLFVVSFDSYILKKYSGIEENGFYGLGIQFVTVCMLFCMAFSQIAMRQFSRLNVGKSNVDSIKKFFIENISMILFLTVFPFTFVYTQLEYILSFFHVSYYDRIDLFKLILLYCFIQASIQFCMSFLYAFNYTKSVMKISVIINLLFVPISLILLTTYGSYGLAVKLIISQLLILFLFLLEISKILHVQLIDFVVKIFFKSFFIMSFVYFFIKFIITYSNNILLTVLIFLFSFILLVPLYYKYFYEFKNKKI